jgi:TfoX/Sxy family transcriptional regulator of competence genes
MPWKKSPPELIKFLDKNMAEFDCQKKTMFGYPAYFINNNMFAGAYEDNLFLRLSDDAREEILSAENEVSPFEPMPGRTMKEYVVLSSSFYKDRTKFIKWLGRSYDYVSSLPPKEPKRKKRK